MFEWLGRRPSQAREAELKAIPVNRIEPNPFQPRTTMDQAELSELTGSIRKVGVLQPVVVRPQGDGYELVLGERRWRGAQAAGLKRIPAIVRSLADGDVAVAALVENLQRSDLSFWDEAAGYARILETFGITQEQLAASVGKKQSTIANKLRVLRLSEEVRGRARAAGLGERHVRALLRLPDETARLMALDAMAEGEMSAREAEAFVETWLQGEETAEPRGESGRGRRTSLPVIRDVRIMLNTFRQGVEALRQAGLAAEMRAREREDHIEVTIRIPRG